MILAKTYEYNELSQNENKDQLMSFNNTNTSST